MTIPSVGIAFGAELDVGDPNGDDKEQSLKAAWRAWTMPRILTVTFQIPAVASPTTTAVRVGEGPQAMRQWTVKRFIADIASPVGGTEPGATVTGAFLFADTTGLSHVSPGQLPATQLRWRWGSSPLPITQAWTDEQLTIFGPEDLVFVVTTSGAVAALAGQAQVVDEPMYILDFETWLNTIRE